MTARVILLRTLVLAMSLAWSDGLRAQTTLPDPRGRWRNSITDLLSRSATLTVMPGVGLVTGSPTRTGVGATIAWTSDADANVAASIALGLMGARTGNQGFTRSGIDGRLEWRAEGVRAWIGAGAAAAAGSGPGNVFSMELGGSAGGLRLDIRSAWLLETDSVTSRDTLTSSLPRSTDELPGDARYTDAEITASHAFGSFAAQAVFGARFGESGEVFGNTATRNGEAPDRWAFANVTVPLRERLSLVAGGGWQPERREIAQRGGAFTSVSLRFDLRDTRAATNVIPPQPLTPSMLSAEPIGEHRYRLRIAIEAQRSVELQGDLTHWQPVAFRPAGSQNLWEISVAAGPGVYHVNLRVDGGDWIVPAGLPRVPDGFGGAAGLLTLK